MTKDIKLTLQVVDLIKMYDYIVTVINTKGASLKRKDLTDILYDKYLFLNNDPERFRRLMDYEEYLTLKEAVIASTVYTIMFEVLYDRNRFFYDFVPHTNQWMAKQLAKYEMNKDSAIRDAFNGYNSSVKKFIHVLMQSDKEK